MSSRASDGMPGEALLKEVAVGLGSRTFSVRRSLDGRAWTLRFFRTGVAADPAGDAGRFELEATSLGRPSKEKKVSAFGSQTESAA